MISQMRVYENRSEEKEYNGYYRITKTVGDDRYVTMEFPHTQFSVTGYYELRAMKELLDEFFAYEPEPRNEQKSEEGA